MLAERIVFSADGWHLTQRNALLVIARAPAVAISKEAAVALGQLFPQWARNPDLYAVLLDQAVTRLEVTDVARDAGPAVAELIWRLECFSKPTITLANGPVGDLGWALACAGTHQGVGPNFSYASRALSGGRAPPGNVIAILARSAQNDQSRLVQFLGGREKFGSKAARAAGFATHTIDAASFRAVEAGLADAEPVDPLLDALTHDPPGKSAQPSTDASAASRGDIAQFLLANSAKLTVDRALALACRIDEALLRHGPGAALTTLTEAIASIEVLLPERRVLQSLRKV